MDKEDQIRRRAHEIWEQEGRPHGRDEEHWHKAASEVEGGGGTRMPAPKPAKQKSVKETYEERRDSPGVTGETIPPPVSASKPKAPRGKGTAKAKI